MAAASTVLILNGDGPVGNGHNGLVAAAYLARAGWRVLVVERRSIAGGACVTEEVFPGYQVSTAVYLVSLLQEKVVRDLEEEYGLTGGNIFHGALSLDQLFFMRPFAGWARYATPIRQLYLCGSGTHPGGGVTGAPGHNAAHEIQRRERW